MKLLRFLSISLLIPLFAFSMHKYYISLCEIEYVKDEQSIQIILGLFIDDIEVTLNKNNDTNLYLSTDKERDNVDELFHKYLTKHFKLEINNELKSFKYIGKEYDDDIVRFYLEITNIEELNSISIYNTSLFRDFPDQQNIIKINANKIHNTFYLTKENPNCLLNF